MIDGESRLTTGSIISPRLQWGRRIESAKAASSGHPIDAAARFQQVNDLAIGQALSRAIVGECVSIEPRQSFRSAEPKKSFGVSYDAVGLVVRQSIGCSVNLNRQSLRPSADRRAQKEDQQQKEAKRRRLAK